MAQNIKRSMPDQTMQWVVQDSISSFKTYSQLLVNEWEIGRSDFNSTIHAAENQTQVGGGIGTLTFYGIDLVLMIHENQISSIFKGDVTKNYSSNTDSGSGCFRPGTQVLTDGGPINIEELREGTRVLTSGGEVPAYGICSNEQVVQSVLIGPTLRRQLWGINEDQPFFTSQHVFHTTTGLRAVDPVKAKLENPWLEVGALMVGHSLIHTTDGKTYKPVEIRTLHHEVADCDTIHGVHLREGQRSYHANGYLVHLNYPEITIKSLSKLLLQLDRKQRLHILSVAKELKPLFNRFGATTLLDALHQQISNADGTPKMPISRRPGVRMLAGAEHVVRRFSLTLDDPSQSASLPTAHLPSLEVSQGVLLVDGIYCPHAELRGRRIVWSRQVNGESWEHGYCHLLPDLYTGIGSVVYSPDKEMPSSEDAGTAYHFVANPMTKQSSFDNTTSDDQMVSPTAPKHPLQGKDSDHVDTAAAPASTPSRMAAAEKLAHAAAPTPAPVVPFLPAPKYTEIDRYNVSYDIDPWIDGKAAPTRPVPLFDVYTTVVDESRTVVCRIPILDQLRDGLIAKSQKKFNLALPTAPELYNSVMSSDAQGNVLFQFNALEPDLISRSADNYDPANPSVLRYSSLAFTKLGVQEVLPLVFSKMRLTLSWDGQSVSGVVRECDPTMVGFDGARHLISGTWHDPNASSKRAQLANGTVGTKPGSPLDIMRAAHLPPGNVAVRLSASSSILPSDLNAGARELASLALPGNTVHEKSQELLLRTMKFHMSDDDLKNFMGESRPTEGPGEDQVPSELGTNLDVDAQSWLQFKYIPAFIGRMICNASADTKKTWRRSLTAAEEKQINYWWTGKGRGCLSQDPIYNRLNEIAARQAVLSVAPRLQDYLSSPRGGAAWAKTLYDTQSKGPALNQIAESLSTTDLGPIPSQVPRDGWTADNEPYSQRLVAAVQGIQTDPFQTQFISISNDPFVVDEYQWLYDAMSALLQALFSDDPSVRLSGPTADALRKDATDLAEATGNKDLETKDMHQLAQTQGVLVMLRRLAAAAGKGIALLSKDTRTAGTAASAAVEEALGDSAVAKALGSLGAKMAAHGLMFATTVGLFIMASYSAFTDWRYLTSKDHARLILQTMQTTLIAFDQLRDFRNAFLQYRAKKNGESNLPPKVEDEIELDDLDQGTVNSAMEQGVRENPKRLNLGDLRRPDGSVQPDDPSVIRIREARANAAREMGNEERKSDSEEEVDEHERAVPLDEPPVPRSNSIADGGDVLETEAGGGGGGVTAELRGLARVKAAFTVAANVVRALLIQVGTALMVLSCIQLSQSWSSLQTWEKVLNIASIAIQAALVVVDMVALAVEVGLEVGFLAAATNPFVAPVLVVVGLVIMFVLIFCGSKPEPPLTPTESWIDDSNPPDGKTPPTGHAFCTTIPTDPGPQLSWTNNTANSTLPRNSDVTLTVTGTNNLGRDVYLDQIKFNFTSGGVADALFRGDTWTAKPSDQTTPLADTQVEVVTAPDTTVASDFEWGVEQRDISRPDSSNTALNLVTWQVSVQQQPPPVPVQPPFDPTPVPAPQDSTPPPAPQPAPTPAPQTDPKLYTMHFPPGSSITFNLRGQTGARSKPYLMEVAESWVDDKYLPFDGNIQQWTFN
ncbi:hypothetical protein N0V85_009084 [Neurospora sp. IMI 360204]|nr:hypothetical protein N0V85_009084 [Neurospora sp. IMI 360204]